MPIEHKQIAITVKHESTSENESDQVLFKLFDFFLIDDTGSDIEKKTKVNQSI